MTAHDLDLEPIEVPAEGSVLDVIRRRREESQAERHYDVLVPGYGGQLVVRCEPMRGEQLTSLRLRLQRSKDPSRDFDLAADVLIAVCVDVLARKTRTAELEPLSPEGETVRIDASLAELLQIESQSARGLVRELFDKAPSPELAVGDAVGDYLAWAQGEDADIDEGLLGES